MEVTNIDYIKKISDGQVIEITGWEEDIPFICKVKRVSLLNLVSKGRIPNSLLGPVMALFDGDKEKVDKIDAKQMADIIEIFCSGTLVNPSYEEVGDYLTDTQRTELFNFAQGGLKQLESFRNQREDTISDINSTRLQEEA